MNQWKLAAAFLLLGYLPALGAAPASQPASQPSGETRRTMARELYNFVDPPNPGWSVVDYKPDSDGVMFVTDSRDAEMQIAMLPRDASVDGGRADNFAVAVIKELRAQRKKAGATVVLPAKSEKDSRFEVCVHEKYKVGEKTADQLHIYRSVGPRVLMMTVNSVADDPDLVAAEHGAAKDLLASVKYNRKAFKKDR